MQKSFILALGAFAVVAFLFVFGGKDVKNTEVVTSFEVSDSGITVNNDFTGESFVIADDDIMETAEIIEEMMDIEPASGSTDMDITTEIVIEDVANTDDDAGTISTDIDTVMAIQEDVVDMVEDAKTATTSTIATETKEATETIEVIDTKVDTITDVTTDVIQGIEIKQDMIGTDMEIEITQ